MNRFALALVFLMLSDGSAVAQILNNGSFETGTDPGPNFARLNPGNTNIANWAVLSGNVDYLGTLVTACNGTRSVDLNGNTAGAISQAFPTAPGTLYVVTFCMAGNTNGPPAVKTLDVSATGGTVTSYQFASTGFSLSNPGWAQETYTFLATAPSTTIAFTSTTPNSAFGPLVDNVIVTPLQQPPPGGENIPTLNEWGFAIFIALIALSSIYVLRRRGHRPVSRWRS